MLKTGIFSEKLLAPKWRRGYRRYKKEINTPLNLSGPSSNLEYQPKKELMMTCST